VDGGANVNATSDPASFFVDYFRVLRSGVLLFEHTFDIAPPAGSTVPINTLGSLWSVAGGKGTAAAEGTVQTYQPQAEQPRLTTAATFGSSITPPPDLRKDVGFSAQGTFDIVVPDELQEAYGIYVTNGNSATETLPQRQAQLLVARGSDDIVRVFFFQDNQ
jgi:hypothetical protein